MLRLLAVPRKYFPLDISGETLISSIGTEELAPAQCDAKTEFGKIFSVTPLGIGSSVLRCSLGKILTCQFGIVFCGASESSSDQSLSNSNQTFGGGGKMVKTASAITSAVDNIRRVTTETGFSQTQLKDQLKQD